MKSGQKRGNKMKKLLMILAMLFTATVSHAANQSATFVWTYPEAENSKITHFDMYNEQNVKVVSAIPATSRMTNYTIVHDGVTPQGFYLVAVDARIPTNIVQSENSNIAIWVPGKRVVVIPGGFSGTNN